MENAFSDPDPAQPDALIIGKAAHPTQRTSQKRTKRFMRDDTGEDDIIVVPKVFPNRPPKEQVLVENRTATKNANTSEAGNQKKDETNDQSNGEKHFDGKEAAVLTSGVKSKRCLAST